MKKPNRHLNELRNRRSQKLRTKQLQVANRRRNARLHPRKTLLAKQTRRYLKLKQQDLARTLHQPFQYRDGTTRVDIRDEFGLEETQSRSAFLDYASRCIDFNTSELTLDIAAASRIWPSAVVLFCSLKEWVEFGARYTGTAHPTITSNNSKSDAVNSYLNHCGFHSYVGRKEGKVATKYSAKEVVRIQRERDRNSVEPREIELLNLIKQHSALSSDQIEYFDDVILTETFNNVIEHGIPNYDQGWFVFAQCHFHHGFISLCIADTGIGIRHTLMLGPQAKDIAKMYPNLPDHDGDFIKLAMTANVSGSFDASTKSGILIKRYSSGARRGHGLERIMDTCKALRIDMCLMSHYGYAVYDSKEDQIRSGAFPTRVFAGAMYEYIIPARVG